MGAAAGRPWLPTPVRPEPPGCRRRARCRPARARRSAFRRRAGPPAVGHAAPPRRLPGDGGGGAPGRGGARPVAAPGRLPRPARTARRRRAPSAEVADRRLEPPPARVGDGLRDAVRRRQGAHAPAPDLAAGAVRGERDRAVSSAERRPHRGRADRRARARADAARAVARRLPRARHRRAGRALRDARRLRGRRDARGPGGEGDAGERRDRRAAAPARGAGRRAPPRRRRTATGWRSSAGRRAGGSRCTTCWCGWGRPTRPSCTSTPTRPTPRRSRPATGRSSSRSRGRRPAVRRRPLLTERDVAELASRGETLASGGPYLLTPAARDRAKALGIWREET